MVEESYCILWKAANWGGVGGRILPAEPFSPPRWFWLKELRAILEERSLPTLIRGISPVTSSRRSLMGLTWLFKESHVRKVWMLQN